jgi:hypothetical protein
VRQRGQRERQQRGNSGKISVAEPYLFFTVTVLVPTFDCYGYGSDSGLVPVPFPTFYKLRLKFQFGLLAYQILDNLQNHSRTLAKITGILCSSFL